MAGGAIGGSRFKISILEGFATMTLQAELHRNIFYTIVALWIMTIRTSQTCGSMNSMMEHHMFWQNRFSRPRFIRCFCKHGIQFLNPFAFSQRQTMAIHTIFFRRHVGSSLRTRPSMACGTIQPDRISMNLMIKRNLHRRHRLPCFLTPHKICQKEGAQNTKNSNN